MRLAAHNSYVDEAAVLSNESNAHSVHQFTVSDAIPMADRGTINSGRIGYWSEYSTNRMSGVVLSIHSANTNDANVIRDLPIGSRHSTQSSDEYTASDESHIGLYKKWYPIIELDHIVIYHEQITIIVVK
jgi:hypothetical protein